MYINSSTNIEKLAQEVFWLSESKGFFYYSGDYQGDRVTVRFRNFAIMDFNGSSNVFTECLT